MSLKWDGNKNGLGKTDKDQLEVCFRSDWHRDDGLEPWSQNQNEPIDWKG